MVQKKTLIKQSLIILIAFILVLLTLLIPREVSSREVQLGYPVQFVSQNLSGNSNLDFDKANISVPSANSTNIMYSNFLVSLLLVVFVVEIFAFFSERMFYREKKKK